jgi:hypothetical protein
LRCRAARRMGGSADSVERGARQDDPPLCLRLCSRPSSDSDGLPTCASPRKTGRAEASSEHNRRLSEAGKAPDSQGLRWPWRGRAFKILLRFARSGSLLLRDRLGVQTGTANLRTLFNAYPKQGGKGTARPPNGVSRIERPELIKGHMSGRIQAY